METQQTASPIIHYIYGSKNLQRIDAFNKANQEIISLLKSKEKDERIKNHIPLEVPSVKMWNGKPLYKNSPKPPKQEPVPSTGNNSNYRKVFDYIVNKKLDYGEILAFDHDFKTAQDIKAVFANLRNSHYAKEIDAIYIKHGLELMPFSTWKASYLNKGPSDRDQLKGDTIPSHIYEVRMIVRSVLMERFSDRLLKPMHF